MQPNSWQYDAFISYNLADEKWVWEWFIPRLKADGVRVCTDEAFDIGVPRITNIENAVAASRHIVLVLTPDWVQDEWNNFDYLLTHYEDPIGLRQRTLPVLHRPSLLPRRLSILTHADLTGARTDAQYQKLLDALRGERHLSNLDDFGAPLTAPPPRVAPATPRQVALGFYYNPFAFPVAEDMPQAILEETFVLHAGFAEHFMDLNRSAILLAPAGGGKTASRRLIESHLEQCHNRALAGDFSGPAIAALTVIYNDFEMLVEHLPQVGVADHTQPLLVAVAEAIYKYIAVHHHHFITCDKETRDWWWSFLDIYLSGELLPIRLIAQHSLNADYYARSVKHSALFRTGSTLQMTLATVLRYLKGLKIERIFILIDEMDGSQAIQSSPNLVVVAKPLLNTLALLSLPGVVWKFFLPAELEQVVYSSSGYRKERLHVAPMTWGNHNSTEKPAHELTRLLRQRLTWASKGKISNIDELGSLELRGVRIEQELVKKALQHRRLGPPRALLELGSKLLETMQGQQISLTEWNAFEQRIALDIVPVK